MTARFRPLIRAALAAGLLMLQAPGWAAEDAARQTAPDAPAQALAAFEQQFRARNPGTRIDAVAASPIPGLFEVVMGRNVAYVDASGRYALFGNIYDMQERRDLTADRRAAVDRIDPRTLPKELALRHVRGAGRRVLYVFADPQCGYCQQQEQALQQVDDVTVYTFLLPILGPESQRLAESIVCSAQPAAAWSAWMLRREQPTATVKDCEHPIEAVGKLAQGLGVAGTPLLIAGDGRKNAGAMSAEQLGAWLGAPPAVASSSGPAQR